VCVRRLRLSVYLRESIRGQCFFVRERLPPPPRRVYGEELAMLNKRSSVVVDAGAANRPKAMCFKIG
jgi:hypothetical protein